ncbi:MAG: sortase [Chloroflexaceae bacterium]|jgi:LPXTG-site transpeptidase (sortase) family protein|nr:sortase [Chloroflexaceae bacterium]
MVSKTRIKPVAFSGRRPRPKTPMSKLVWTLGNLMMVAGLYLLLYVGGVYAQVEHNRMAARGDNDLPPPQARFVDEAPAGSSEPLSLFSVPVISNSGQLASQPPELAPGIGPSTVSRIIIPSIGVDSKVVEVGWKVEEQQGQQVAVWEVAEYAVGHHKGSANPGQGENVVLAGHVGGYGLVFLDLYYVKPGDKITLYSNGVQYLYTVTEHLVVDEEGQPPEVRAANARYIEPTGSEVVTLVTCWPPSGPQKFLQRVIVRAVPFGTTAPAPADGPGNWTIR